MDNDCDKINNSDKPLSEAKILGIVMEDILFRSPLYGIVVLILLGGLSYFFIWLTLNILKPFMLGN